MKTIVIKVWRGMVSEVYSDDPNVNVTVLDEDAPDAEADTQLPEHRVYQ